MSTRILFADDSMTAQNMGKKILTEAGYEVVAVSNGAAAVKKIAEQKPDIIILDIYMPGYSGLEVCDKVRASVDTLKTPVLLTVGKMEPYRAEDANRVKADGVIIKPFEASDLLAVIKKLEERVVPKTVAIADKTIRLDRLPDFDQVEPESPESLPEMRLEAATNGTPAIVDVPDNMATSAAFSDLLGPEPANSFDSFHTPAVELPVTPAIADEPAAPAAFSPTETAVSQNGTVEVQEFTALPAESAVERLSQPAPAHVSEFEVTPTVDTELKITQEAAIEEFSPAAVEGTHSSPALAEDNPAASAVEEAAHAHTSSSLSSSGPASSWPDTHPIPVYREPELHSIETGTPASAPTAANNSWSDVAEPTSEETHIDQPRGVAAPVAEEASPVVETPVLATEGVDFDTFSARVEAQIQEIETMVTAAQAHSAEPAVKPQVEDRFEHSAVAPADDDFEARVAAAMSIYDKTAEQEIEVSPAASALETGTSEQPVQQPASLHMLRASMAPDEAKLEAPYSFEYSPGITVPEPEEVDEPVAAAATPELAAQTAEPVVETPSVIEPVVQDPLLELPVEAEDVIALSGEMPAAVAITSKPPTQAEPYRRETVAPIRPAGPAASSKVGSQVKTPRAATETPESAVQTAPPPVETILVETPSVAQPAVRDPLLELPVEAENVTASPAKTPFAAEEPTAAQTQSRVDDETILSEIEGEIEAQLPPASVASADPALNTQVIASAVHRVLERLKPHLIEEISRELKNMQ